ncbi:MAG: dephospho-CoA kinase [Pseudomonadota bacterium]
MIILGLTGSIGMGKSTTAKMFADAGVPVYDADAAVHTLYKEGPLVDAIEAAFPGTTDQNGVDRKKLGRAVLGNQEKIQRLENLVHPAVRTLEQNFVALHRSANEKLIVLDIPLLFETEGDARVDKIVMVTAPYSVQQERVLSRPGMTKDQFEKILARQTPDAAKRERADFIIDTSKGLDSARNAVAEIIENLTG